MNYIWENLNKVAIILTIIGFILGFISGNFSGIFIYKKVIKRKKVLLKNNKIKIDNSGDNKGKIVGIEVKNDG